MKTVMDLQKEIENRARMKARRLVDEAFREVECLGCGNDLSGLHVTAGEVTINWAVHNLKTSFVESLTPRIVEDMITELLASHKDE